MTVLAGVGIEPRGSVTLAHEALATDFSDDRAFTRRHQAIQRAQADPLQDRDFIERVQLVIHERSIAGHKWTSQDHALSYETMGNRGRRSLEIYLRDVRKLAGSSAILRRHTAMIQ